MLKVCSLFKIQALFDGDALSEVWIQCTCCKKLLKIKFLISNRNFPQRKSFTCFYQICCVSSCCYLMDDRSKGENHSEMDENDEGWRSGGPCSNDTVCKNLHGPLFK